MKRTSTDFEEISTKELFSKLDEDSKVSPNCSARRKPSLEYHVMQKDGIMSSGENRNELLSYRKPAFSDMSTVLK